MNGSGIQAGHLKGGMLYIIYTVTLVCSVRAPGRAARRPAAPARRRGRAAAGRIRRDDAPARPAVPPPEVGNLGACPSFALLSTALAARFAHHHTETRHTPRQTAQTTATASATSHGLPGART